LLQGFASPVIAVDVRYFGDGRFDFKWAFKKLPKSIPGALKDDFRVIARNPERSRRGRSNLIKKIDRFAAARDDIKWIPD